jgi:ADP-dependent NAD(P)H-hydrate dehydratase
MTDRVERGGEPERLGPHLVTTWPLPIDEGGDKHVRGTVLVIGGSPVTAGAVVLAGIAALRMGAERLQIAAADVAAAHVGVAVPEALSMPLAMTGDTFVADVAAPGSALHGMIGRADAVLLGPGMRGHDDAPAFVAAVLRAIPTDATVVVDALAMQTVAEQTDLLAPLANRVVLTPNRQELDRLSRDGDGAGEGEDELAAVAARFGAVITSFGEIAAPDGRRWSCGHGTPGLGTSGSGDVLAGLIAGAAARCGDAAQAACWGTYVHSAAGCRLSDRMGRLGFLARELLEEVPALWADLESAS